MNSFLYLGKASEVVQWIGKWLVCVSRFLEKQYDASEESLQKIRAISVFPLSKGNLTSLLSGSLFFPLEKNNAKKSRKGNYDTKSIPSRYEAS